MKFLARLRALERRFAITPGLKVPKVITEYVACGERDPDGHLGPPPEPTFGCVDNPNAERVQRNPGESVEEFSRRLLALATKKGKVPPQVFLFPPGDPPKAKSANLPN